eukprot:8630658-Alexandrium_andersonii.AAC.1
MPLGTCGYGIQRHAVRSPFDAAMLLTLTTLPLHTTTYTPTRYQLRQHLQRHPHHTTTPVSYTHLRAHETSAHL